MLPTWLQKRHESELTPTWRLPERGDDRRHPESASATLLDAEDLVLLDAGEPELLDGNLVFGIV